MTDIYKETSSRKLRFSLREYARVTRYDHYRGGLLRAVNYARARRNVIKSKERIKSPRDGCIIVSGDKEIRASYIRDAHTGCQVFRITCLFAADSLGLRLTILMGIYGLTFYAVELNAHATENNAGTYLTKCFVKSSSFTCI